MSPLVIDAQYITILLYSTLGCSTLFILKQNYYYGTLADYE